MTSLELELRALIEAEGPMPVSRYMALCLGHPRHGYYATRDPLGAAGDFITAPEISQMFGELIGLWCAEAWRGMREPARIRLVELGPGRGTLMQDMLRAAKLVPGFEKAIEVHLVETSPVLAALQREKLADAEVPVTWHESAADLPAGPLLMIANEFVDALPIDRFVKTANGWCEQRVGIAKEKLVFGLHPTPLSGFDESLPTRLRRAPEGSVLERRNLAPLAGNRDKDRRRDRGGADRRLRPPPHELRRHACRRCARTNMPTRWKARGSRIFPPMSISNRWRRSPKPKACGCAGPSPRACFCAASASSRAPSA